MCITFFKIRALVPTKCCNVQNACTLNNRTWLIDRRDRIWLIKGYFASRVYELISVFNTRWRKIPTFTTACPSVLCEQIHHARYALYIICMYCIMTCKLFFYLLFYFLTYVVLKCFPKSIFITCLKTTFQLIIANIL